MALDGDNRSSSALYSLDAEQALLGAILFDGDTLEIADEIVRAEDFYDPVHAMIFAEARAMRDDGARISPVAIDARLAGSAGYQEMKGRDYLTDLAANVPSTVMAPDYAKIIADYAARRGIYAAAQEMIERAGDMKSKPHEIADAVDAQLADVFENRRTAARGVKAGDAFRSWMERVTARGEGLPGYDAGLTDLDDKLGGFRPGKTYIVAGRPGMGKTTLLAKIAANMAQGGGVAFSTLEQEAEDLPVMWATDLMRDHRIRLPYQQAERGIFTADEFATFEACAKTVAALPILIDDTPTASLPHIRRFARASARRFAAEGRPFRALIVDYLGLIRKNPALRGVDRVAEISQGLAHLARELDVPVIIGCQLNREVERRDDKRPTLADLRESGDIEQDAFAVMFVYREAYYHPRLEPKKSDLSKHQDWELEGQRLAAEKPLEVIIAKNKRGETGAVRLWCEIETAAIRDRGFNPLDPFNEDAEPLL